jgi:hypothetical protein
MEGPRARSGLRGVLRLLRDLIAVLGAILAAFALDAWWSEHSEAARTADLLAAIAGEFEGAVVELDSIVAENDRFMASRVAYLGRAGADSPPVPDDSLAFYLDTYSDFQICNPSFGALSTLIAGGGLERVAEPDLRYSLGGWSGELDDLVFEENQVAVATQSLSRTATELGLQSEITLQYLYGHALDVEVLRRFANSARYREEQAGLVLALSLYQSDLHRVRDRAAAMALRLHRQAGGSEVGRLESNKSG